MDRVYIRYDDVSKVITAVSQNDDLSTVSGETKDYVDSNPIVFYNKDGFEYVSGSSPAILKSITNDLLPSVEAPDFWYLTDDSTGDVDASSTADDLTPASGQTKRQSQNCSPHNANFAWRWNGSDFEEKTIYPYRIEEDASDGALLKDITAIDYKTELKDNVAYTPDFEIKTSGIDAGCLSKTTYYKDFVDNQNMGTKVLEVVESYSIDDSNPSEHNTAKDCLYRDKTWKHYKTDGSLDEDRTKTKRKHYNTRRKKHIEGIRRRENVLEQLIDNVALAGILSGHFTDEADAFDKLVALQESHEIALSSWKNSGLGSIFNDIDADATAWLDATVADTPSTQAMCSWMIGMKFKDYMIDKLKGNID